MIIVPNFSLKTVVCLLLSSPVVVALLLCIFLNLMMGNMCKIDDGEYVCVVITVCPGEGPMRYFTKHR